MARKGAKAIAGSTPEWDRYHLWNEAIAENIFSPGIAGRPAYLDLEDDLLAAVAGDAEPDAADPAEALIDAVMATLVFRDGPNAVLAGHLERLRRWHDTPMMEPPPTLALLAMLSLIAETMHEGGGMMAHNFWGRTKSLLGLDDQRLSWLQMAYRSRLDGVPTSTMLWESLNHWLEMQEGNRGLPTAQPIGHEHIGYPLSQALVRQADREHFADLFAFNSLPPRSSLPSVDMETLIDEWMSRRPCPASNTLERLWASGRDARARIVDVACTTLSSWDGASNVKPTESGRRALLDLIRLSAVLRNFPSRRLDLGLAISANATSEVEHAEVSGANNDLVGSVDLVPAASGYLQLADPASIEMLSLLGGVVHIRRASSEQVLRRRPRRAIPMRLDPLLGAFVECERIQLGEESLLLVQDSIEPETSLVLDTVARPGFKKARDLPGLPPGWTLFSGVQVLSSIPADLRRQIKVDLNVLQPIATSQVVLQGGMQLPGNIAKWLTALPPELRVTAEAGATLSASLTCVRPLAHPPPPDRSLSGSGEVLVWDLAKEDLLDGDYRIAIHDGDGEPTTVSVRLRSADNPALALDAGTGTIGYNSSTPGLFATRSARAGVFQVAPLQSPPLPHGTPPLVPGWYGARRDAPKQEQQLQAALVIPSPEASSCMVTGAHLMKLPMATAHMTTVDGICAKCGLVKRYPALRGRRKSGGGQRGSAAPRVNVGSLPPVGAEMTINWTAAFDAVCHVGSGTATMLNRITSQLESTNLFGDAFERRLDMLGHIEIERHEGSLMPKGWQVANPRLIGLPDGVATIAGFRSERMLVALEDQVWDLKGGWQVDAGLDGPPAVRISGLGPEQLEWLAEVMGDAAGREALYIPSAGERLASALRPLSVVRTSLPRLTTTAAHGYERWDPSTARFHSCADANAPGAFRLTSFTRTYIYRSADDVAMMSAQLADARIVKYLAAADSGRSLIGYDPGSQTLYVPLGADLPGLYGRAAVLASGYPPTENLDERILQYRGVPPDLAGHLNRLLMS